MIADYMQHTKSHEMLSINTVKEHKIIYQNQKLKQINIHPRHGKKNNY